MQALIIDADGTVVAVDGDEAPVGAWRPRAGQPLPAALLAEQPFGAAGSLALHDGLAAVLARRRRRFELQLPLNNGDRVPLLATVQALEGDRSGAVLTFVRDGGVAPPRVEPAAAPASATGREPELTPVLERLRGADGIDAAAGLAAVGGRAAVYERLLAVFVRSHDGDAARIGAAVAAGSPDARALAHRLRGSAATLGLLAVEQACAAIEHAPPQATAAELQPQVAALDAALAAALAQLRRAAGGD